MSAGRNTGHGHVFPRPDGLKARCSGELGCHSCQSDAQQKAMQMRSTGLTLAEGLSIGPAEDAPWRHNPYMQTDGLSELIGQWDAEVPASPAATTQLLILMEIRRRLIALENPT